MKTAIRLTLIAALVSSLGSIDTAVAAKNWTWYVDFINVVQGSPGYADVVIAIKANSAGDVGRLGNGSIDDTTSAALYDFLTANPPIIQTNHLGASYTMAPFFNRPGANVGRLSFSYDGATGSGNEVTQSGILVATLRFYILNPSGVTNFRFRRDRQETFEDNNTTAASVSYDNSGGSAPLPIQMASFTASVVRDNDVEVAWKTVSETNNYGFEIHRKRGETGDWTKIDFIEGHGTTLAPQAYSYIDRSVSFGKYFYRIKQIDLDGTSETFPEMAVTVGVGVDKFVLAQNYPNPFNPSTLIEFVVPVSGHTTMKVYNVLGQVVATLYEGNAESGKINAARFDASNLPSGLYFYTLRSAGKADTKRMLLLK
jgi:hypothetical protein